MCADTDIWNSGDPYEYFMGRWSRKMAPVFLEWLNQTDNLRWLDVGCGTGALSEAICQNHQPQSLICVDPSEKFLEKARQHIACNAEYFTGTATNLPIHSSEVGIVVSGLAFNFFPDTKAALTEMKRVLVKDGLIAVYVWDYAGRMEFLRKFWDAAIEADIHAKELDEGQRFPICNAEKLVAVFELAGLTNIQTTNLDISTVFKDFSDYWNPFLGAQGPAPAYLASIDKALQDKIKAIVREKLPVQSDGSISLIARAIAIRGTYS